MILITYILNYTFFFFSDSLYLNIQYMKPKNKFCTDQRNMSMLRNVFGQKFGITVFTNKAVKSRSPLYTLLTSKFNNPSKKEDEEIPIQINTHFPTPEEWSYIRGDCNRSLNVYKDDDAYGINDIIKKEDDLKKYLGKSQLPAEMKKEGSLYSWDGELWVDWENKKYGVYKYNVEDKNL